MRSLLLPPLVVLLAGCASVSTRNKQAYWNGEGLDWNDRYYIGAKHDYALLHPDEPTPIGPGTVIFTNCDMIGSALLDTLCLPMDFYLVETDGRNRKSTYSDKGY